MLCAGILTSQLQSLTLPRPLPLLKPVIQNLFTGLRYRFCQRMAHRSNIEGQSAVLMDAVTDTILYSKNAKG